MRRDKKRCKQNNGIISESKSSFSKKAIKNFAFGKDDFPNVKAKIRNYKKRRRQKNPKANAGKPAPYALGVLQSNDCNIIICDFFEKVKSFLKKTKNRGELFLWMNCWNTVGENLSPQRGLWTKKRRRR